MVIAPPKAEPDTTYAVNQELPILLSWSPKGFARYFQFQLATDTEFTTPLVDTVYMTEGFYVFETAGPGTTYYYRVKTQNEGGASEWAVGAFQTVPPMLEVTAPTDGESLTRGLDYFIKFNDNIAEDVVIELYKGAAPVLTIGTVPSDRAYEWEVDLGLERGIGYSIKISSATDPSLFDVSGSFTIDIPVGDLNGDGKVDLADVAILAENFLTEIP